MTSGEETVAAAVQQQRGGDGCAWLRRGGGAAGAEEQEEQEEQSAGAVPYGAVGAVARREKRRAAPQWARRDVTRWRNFLGPRGII